MTVLLFCSLTTSAQQWVALQNGTGNGDDVITAMAVDNAGNVYVTGYSFSATQGSDYLTIKYSTNGVPLWKKRYNGPGNGDDNARAIFVDQNGNVYVTGISDSYPSFGLDNDVATLKYNSQGALQWVARYDGNIIREDAGNAIRVDQNGNVYVAGYKTVNTIGYSAPDYLTLKYNAAGALQWSVTHNGPGNAGDVAVGLGLDDAGNIYVTGTDFAGGDPLGEGDIVTIKYNPAGVEQWLARFNGTSSESDGATGIAVAPDGNCYVTGSTRIGGIDVDFVTIKYNTNGIQQWTAFYGGDAGQGDIPAAITIDAAQNVYIIGTDQKIPYYYDYLTIKYNSTGQTQWTARYNGKVSGNDWPTSIDVDLAGNVYVTGQSIGINFTWDFATIKYSSSGVKLWARTYDGAGHGDDVAYAVKADQNGNVYVAGAGAGPSNLNYTTIKYNSSGHKESMGTPANDQSVLAPKIYPNPFSSSTTMEYFLPQNSDVVFTITDIRGNVLQQLNYVSMPLGLHTFSYDGSKLSGGIYFCEMKAGEISYTTKMELIK